MSRRARLAILATVCFGLNLFFNAANARAISLQFAKIPGKTGLFAASAAIPGALAAMQDPSSGAALTNADVIKMVQAHLSADIVVSQIQTSPCRFSLTPSSLIALKQAGVPDKVIAAMQAKSGAGASAGSAGGAHASGAIGAGREYTAAEFEKLLPAILSKAAVAHGLGAHDYDKEAAYIGEFVETCALDSTNVRVQMPNPRLPQYEICQRSTAAHTHIEGMLDVSVAAQSWHSEDGTKRVARGDLLMDVGIPPTGRWFPGERYSVTLKILVDRAPNRLDDVVSDAHIKGHLPKPSEASADSTAPTASAPANPAKAATPYPVFDPAAAGKDFDQSPAYELGLLYIRRIPSVLDDPRTLQSFVRLISCADSKVSMQMGNEFDAPQVSAYYRNNGASFLSNVPSKFKLRIRINLGEYDFANSYFPFRASSVPQEQSSVHPDPVQQPRQGVSFDRVDYKSVFAVGSVCARSALQWNLPDVDQSPTVYEVAFDPVAIDRIPMDQAAAHSYIESHSNRGADIVVEIHVSDEAPKVYPGVKGTNKLSAVVFRGHVTGIALYDSYPNGKAIQALSSVAAASAPDASGTQSAASAAAAPAVSGTSTGTAESPSSGASGPGGTALPIPVVHDGVAGKVLMGFVEKCSAGDSKGCEMVGFDLERGWGADKDPQAAKAYYQKACSMGRKNDCGR